MEIKLLKPALFCEVSIEDSEDSEPERICFFHLELFGAE